MSFANASCDCGRSALWTSPRLVAALIATGSALLLAASSAVASDTQAAPLDLYQLLFARPKLTDAKPNPTEAARIKLGAALFSDTRLSKDGNKSCATCHQAPTFTDGLQRAAGRTKPLPRNTPTLLGIAKSKHFNWDGSARFLTQQFERPITSPDEMAGVWPEIVRRLSRDQMIHRAFAKAFPGVSDSISRARIKVALAAAVRSLEPPRTRFDDYIAGDQIALTPIEQRGLRLFIGKAQCVTCHATGRLTDDRFHDIGVARHDPGRAVVTGRPSDQYRFKTPTLRQIAKTAPYMHDGSLATLEQVVRHYERGGIARPTRAETMPMGLALSMSERKALVAFLKTL